ncbi:putative prefoldin subunit 1 [Aphelenchoides bicaudatus]|nr:putative prefoldin subunit 1 [Aphelenchoides bicaudatus]
MSNEFDEKLRKAIQDLQIQTITTNQKLNELNQTERIMEQNIKVSELAKSEVSKLPEDKGVYHSIGRVFVFRQHDEEIADQNKDIEQYKNKLGEISKQREYLQKNLSEMEQNVREILQTRSS